MNTQAVRVKIQFVFQVAKEMYTWSGKPEMDKSCLRRLLIDLELARLELQKLLLG